MCLTRGLGAAPIDQEAELLVRFASGAAGHIWLSWLATGTPMDIGFEVLGNRGAIRFSWTRSSELQFYDATAPDPERGFTVIQLGPAHPAAAPYLPVAGIGLSYHSAFVPLLGPFLTAIDHGEPHTPGPPSPTAW
jgi:predicted dehydrogenase